MITMATRTKKLAGLLATGLTVAALGACGTVGDSETGGSEPAESKAIEDVTIGVLQRQVDAPFYTAVQVRAEELSKEQGWSLQFQSANGDPVTQLNQAQTMVAQGVDVLVVNAISPETEKAQLEEIAKGTHVLFIDTGIPGVGVSSVSSDNKAIGKLSGELAAKRFDSREEIDVAILNGGPNDEIVGPDRQEGFLSGLESAGVKPNIVAEQSAVYAQDKAVPATESILAANPDVDLILGLNDAMALGALTVLKDQGNEETLVAAASDGQKEALKIMKDEGCESQYLSTGLNSPALATDRVLEIASQLATGEAAPDDFEAEEFTTPAGINCDNVDEYYDEDSVF